MHIMNNTLKLTAATLAAASATWSFAAGNFWPGLLAVLAAGILVISFINREDA